MSNLRWSSLPQIYPFAKPNAQGLINDRTCQYFTFQTAAIRTLQLSCHRETLSAAPWFLIANTMDTHSSLVPNHWMVILIHGPKQCGKAPVAINHHKSPVLDLLMQTHVWVGLLILRLILNTIPETVTKNWICSFCRGDMECTYKISRWCIFGLTAGSENSDDILSYPNKISRNHHLYWSYSIRRLLLKYSQIPGSIMKQYWNHHGLLVQKTMTSNKNLTTSQNPIVRNHHMDPHGDFLKIGVPPNQPF